MADLKKYAAQLIFCAVAAAFFLAGCGPSFQNAREEPKISARENSLASWKADLPQDTEYCQVPANAIRGLSVQKDGADVFSVSYEPRKEKDPFDYWDISVPYQSLVSVNTEALYELFGTVSMMGLKEAKGVTPQDAGISDSTASIFFAYDKSQGEGEKGAAEPTNAMLIRIGKADGNGRYYAALEGSEKVFLINGDVLDTVLGVEAYEYILKIPALVNVGTVSKIQILSGQNSHVIVCGKDAWEFDGEAVTQETFHSLYSSLLDIRVTGEIPGKMAGGRQITESGSPVLTLQFFRNMEGATDLDVKYYEYNDTSMRVSVNGQEYFLVEKSSIEALQKTIEDAF